jgi:NADH-quinone oxidoreductase, chain I
MDMDKVKEQNPKIKEYKKENPFRLFADHLQAVGAGLKYMISPQRITIKYPEESLSLPTGYRGMIRLYKDICIGCTLCALICPADAMKMVTEEGKKLPSINYGRCVFCGFCVDVCPVDALKETRVHDATFTNRRDLVFRPDRFSQDFDEPAPVEGVVKKVKTIIDEKKGIRYVPDE